MPTSHDVPAAVRAYIQDVAARLTPPPSAVLYSTFDGPAAYLLVGTDLLTWSPALGWSIGTPHTDPHDLAPLHEAPDLAPAEVASALDHHQRRNPYDTDSGDVWRWHRAHELPSPADTLLCSHGTPPLAHCQGCEEAQVATRARLLRIAAGYPVDVIA